MSGGTVNTVAESEGVHVSDDEDESAHASRGVEVYSVYSVYLLHYSTTVPILTPELAHEMRGDEVLTSLSLLALYEDKRTNTDLKS